jgi:hypothetical protein
VRVLKCPKCWGSGCNCCILTCVIHSISIFCGLVLLHVSLFPRFLTLRLDMRIHTHIPPSTCAHTHLNMRIHTHIPPQIHTHQGPYYSNTILFFAVTPGTILFFAVAIRSRTDVRYPVISLCLSVCTCVSCRCNSQARTHTRNKHTHTHTGIAESHAIKAYDKVKYLVPFLPTSFGNDIEAPIYRLRVGYHLSPIPQKPPLLSVYQHRLLPFALWWTTLSSFETKREDATK